MSEYRDIPGLRKHDEAFYDAIEEAARKKYEVDYPNGPPWNSASKWIRDSCRDEVRKAPR